MILKKTVLTFLMGLMLSACSDSEILSFDHENFHLPTSLSATEGHLLGTIDDSIKSSHAAYKGLLGLISVIFEDANTQSQYIICSTFRMYHLSKDHMQKKDYLQTLKKVMKKQSFISIREDLDSSTLLMVPMASHYKTLEAWSIDLTPLLGEKNEDIGDVCSEHFYRAIPNSAKARNYEKKALAKYTVLAIQRLDALKKALLNMEVLASLYTGFESTLSKIREDAKKGLSNGVATKEKLAAYNRFLKSKQNKLPVMAEHMPIESNLSSKDLAALLKVF